MAAAALALTAPLLYSQVEKKGKNTYGKRKRERKKERKRKREDARAATANPCTECIKSHRNLVV